MQYFPKHPLPGTRRQAGAATLVVVMTLSFALLLAAIFASRSLMFEQRTSFNLYRATQAFELAEAGAQWTLAQLNGGRVDDRCAPSKQATQLPMRDRYLSIDAATGRIQPMLPAESAHLVCARSGNDWSCSCPGKPLSALPDGLQDRPGFAVVFGKDVVPTQEAVSLTVVGCTRLSFDCARNGLLNGTQGHADATATVRLKIALSPALPRLPAATLTARGAVEAGTASPGIYSMEPGAPGITVDAGGAVDVTNARIVAAPGTPPAASVLANDTALAGLSSKQLFAAFLGMSKSAYKHLPSVKRLACDDGDCTAAIENAYTAGHRMVWIDGDARLAGAAIGADADPLLLVVNGNLRVDGNLQFFGAVYSASMRWNNTTGTGHAFMRGALVTEGDVSGDGSPDYVYDLAILKRLNLTRGTFVIVPGSWTDAQP